MARVSATLLALREIRDEVRAQRGELGEIRGNLSEIRDELHAHRKILMAHTVRIDALITAVGGVASVSRGELDELRRRVVALETR